MSDERDVLEPPAPQAQKRRQDRIVRGWKALLSSRDGRALAWDLLIQTHVHDSSFRGEAGLGMAFLEGERNVGLKILAGIMTNEPGAYTVMSREANEVNSNESED